MSEQLKEIHPQFDILKTSIDLQSRLIRDLKSEADLTEMMTRIVEKTAEVLKASACTVFIINPDGKSATQVAGTGYQKQFNGECDIRISPANEVQEKPKVNNELGLTGWILSTGKPFLAKTPEEVKSHPHHFKRQQKQGYDLELQSFLGVPLHGLYGEVIGMIKAERLLYEGKKISNKPFSVKDQLALETIDRVASRCITYLKMAQQQQESDALTAWARDVINEAIATEGELDSYLDMVVKVTAAAMRSDSCGVFLIDIGDEKNKLKKSLTLTQRAGIGSQALRKVIRAYALPDEQIIRECRNIPGCHPPDCLHRQDRSMTYFKMTEKIFKNLRENVKLRERVKISDGTLKDLESIQNVRVRGEDKFVKALRESTKDNIDDYIKTLIEIGEERVGLTAWIADTGKSFHASNHEDLSAHCHHSGGFDKWNFPDDEYTKCGAFLGVPLQVGGTIIGVVKVENIVNISDGDEDVRDFSKSSQQCFEILAQDIALSIMRLQNQIPDRYRVIRDAQPTILEILRGGKAIKDLVEIVVNRTKDLFDAGACALFLKEGEKLLQPHWAASGWSQRGPKTREYDLALPEDIDNEEEKAGLTVWIAVKQHEFTARSNLELTMHPHHVGTFDDDNFESDEKCESFMGFPLLIKEKEGEANKLVGVLKVESKMKTGETGEQEYTYFNELDELVFELIANSAAIAIQNARLLESRRLAERILAQPDNNNVLRELYEFLQNREEVISTLDETAKTVKAERIDRANIIEGFKGLLEPGFMPQILEQLARQMADPVNVFMSFLTRAIKAQSVSQIEGLCREPEQPDVLPIGSLLDQKFIFCECVQFLSEILSYIGTELRQYSSDPTRKIILRELIDLLQETKKDYLYKNSFKDRLGTMSLFERRVLGRIFDQWREVFNKEYDKFQKIRNPYIVGYPVKSKEMFRGREDIFEFIEDSLIGKHGVRTLVLYGERRTGKTSILFQLREGRLGDGFVPVLMDMEGYAGRIENNEKFLGYLAKELLNGFKDKGIKIAASSSPNGQPMSYDDFEDFLNVLKSQLGNKKIVIMLDEFDEMYKFLDEKKVDKDLFKYLRFLIQHNDVIAFIVAGGPQLGVKIRDYSSILFNMAIPQRVSYLEAKDARRLIREPIESEIVIDEDAVNKIIHLTHGHPYFIQAICFELIKQCNEQKSSNVSIINVNTAVQRSLITGGENLNYLWDNVKDNVEHLALFGLANSIDKDKEWAACDEVFASLTKYVDLPFGTKELVKALDRLIKAEVLEMAEEAHLCYRFQLEVFRLWIKRNYSISDIRGLLN